MCSDASHVALVQHREELMAGIYVLSLTDAERAEPLAIAGKGQTAARRQKRAHILLLADEGATDRVAAKALHTPRLTVERTAGRSAAGSVEQTTTDRTRP